MPTLKFTTTDPEIELDINTLSGDRLSQRRQKSYDGNCGSRWFAFHTGKTPSSLKVLPRVANFPDDDAGPTTKTEDWSFTHSGRTLSVSVWMHSDYDATSEVKSQMKIVAEKLLEMDSFSMLTDAQRKMQLYLNTNTSGGAGYVAESPDSPGDPVIRMFIPTMAVMGTKSGLFAPEAWGKNPNNWLFIVRGYLLHEFGHILHQLQNPAHYYAIADLITARGEELPENVRYMYNSLPSAKDTHNTVYGNNLRNSFGKANDGPLGNYGTANGNEFVAEGFAVLMYGLTDSQAFIDQYNHFGGPAYVHGAVGADLTGQAVNPD